MAAPMRSKISRICGQLYNSNCFGNYPAKNGLDSNIKLFTFSSRLQKSFYGKTHASFHSNRAKSSRRFAGLAVGGFGLGISFGLLVKKGYIGTDSFVQAQSSVLGDLRISRRIQQPTDNTGLKLTLFQYQTCPFCCKVRAYLDYHGFSYDVVEVNSVLRSEIKWSSYKKVPILVYQKPDSDEVVQLNDSSVIISLLETFLVDPTQDIEKILTYYPSFETKNARGKKILEFPNKYFVMYHEAKLSSSDADRKLERKWRRWVEDVLVHTLSPNIYRTPSEALQAFRYFEEVGKWKENFSAPMCNFIVYVGASAMFFIGKILKRRHNLKDDVRESLFEAAKEWAKAVGKKRKFLGGEKPNLADLSVYGVLSSVEGCQAFQELLANTDIKKWYFAMKSMVTNHAGGPPLSKRH